MLRIGIAHVSLLMLVGALPVVAPSLQGFSHREFSPILIPNCGIGSMVPDDLIANATLISPSSSGTILFSCGPRGAAFTVARRGSVVPRFSLPTGYSALEISTDPTCASGVLLKSGRPRVFGVGKGIIPAASYNYCASFSNAPSTGLESFTITWIQHSLQPAT